MNENLFVFAQIPPKENAIVIPIQAETEEEAIALLEKTFEEAGYATPLVKSSIRGHPVVTNQKQTLAILRGEKGMEQFTAMLSDTLQNADLN